MTRSIQLAERETGMDVQINVVFLSRFFVLRLFFFLIDVV